MRNPEVAGSNPAPATSDFMKEFSLKLARSAIENFVKSNYQISIPKEYPKELDQKKGVFVTIYKNNGLRGCVGFPYPTKPMIQGIIQASIEACKDFRFPLLKPEELNEITIEISILTEPELIKVKDPKEYFEKIQIGKHGLIIKKGMYSGLLLPKVPVEQGWDVKDYLENLCLKAGLLADAWVDSEIYKFQAEILR